MTPEELKEWKEKAAFFSSFKWSHWIFLLVVIPLTVAVGIEVQIRILSLMRFISFLEMFVRENYFPYLCLTVISEIILLAWPLAEIPFLRKTFSVLLGTILGAILLTSLSSFPPPPLGLPGAFGALAFAYVANDWHKRRLFLTQQPIDMTCSENSELYWVVFGIRPRFVAGIVFCIFSMATLPLFYLNNVYQHHHLWAGPAFAFTAGWPSYSDIIIITPKGLAWAALTACAYAVLAFRILTNDVKPKSKLDAAERIIALLGLYVAFKIICLAGSGELI